MERPLLVRKAALQETAVWKQVPQIFRIATTTKFRDKNAPRVWGSAQKVVGGFTAVWNRVEAARVNDWLPANDFSHVKFRVDSLEVIRMRKKDERRTNENRRTPRRKDIPDSP